MMEKYLIAQGMRFCFSGVEDKSDDELETMYNELCELDEETDIDDIDLLIYDTLNCKTVGEVLGVVDNIADIIVESATTIMNQYYK